MAQPVTRADADWDRDIDKSIVRVSSTGARPINREDVLATVKSIMEDAAIDAQHWKILGEQQTAPTYTVKLLGAAGVATKRVNTLFAACRTNEGKYREFYAEGGKRQRACVL